MYIQVDSFICFIVTIRAAIFGIWITVFTWCIPGHSCQQTELMLVTPSFYTLSFTCQLIFYDWWVLLWLDTELTSCCFEGAGDSEAWDPMFVESIGSNSESESLRDSPNCFPGTRPPGTRPGPSAPARAPAIRERARLVPARDLGTRPVRPQLPARDCSVGPPAAARTKLSNHHKVWWFQIYTTTTTITTHCGDLYEDEQCLGKLSSHTALRSRRF